MRIERLRGSMDDAKARVVDGLRREREGHERGYGGGCEEAASCGGVTV
jgi:hypothetical protein